MAQEAQDPKTRLRRMQLMGSLIQEAATLSGENRERLMALVWRESWCRFAPPYEPKGSWVGWGDRGFAFGPFQIDRRYHDDFITKELGRYRRADESKVPYNPIGQALYACRILSDARDWLNRSSTSIRGDSLERAVYAAYNAGPARVYRALIRNKDVDTATTGGNYSQYIFNLAAVLQSPAYRWVFQAD